MLKKTLKFSQSDAFIGFNGKMSTGTQLPITQLGVVTFKCRDVVIYEPDADDRIWKDHVEDWYDEYDILIWIGSTILGLLILCCIACCCYVRCKRREVKRLQEQSKAQLEAQKQKQMKYLSNAS